MSSTLSKQGSIRGTIQPKLDVGKGRRKRHEGWSSSFSRNWTPGRVELTLPSPSEERIHTGDSVVSPWSRWSRCWIALCLPFPWLFPSVPQPTEGRTTGSAVTHTVMALDAILLSYGQRTLTFQMRLFKVHPSSLEPFQGLILGSTRDNLFLLRDGHVHKPNLHTKIQLS